jgi:hypothetical protein
MSDKELMLGKGFVLVEYKEEADLYLRQQLLDRLREMKHVVAGVTPVCDYGAMSDERFKELTDKTGESKDIRDLVQEKYRLQSLLFLSQKGMMDKQREWMKMRQEIKDLKDRLAQLGEPT